MSGVIPGLPTPPPTSKPIIPRRFGRFGRAGALGAIGALAVGVLSGLKQYLSQEKCTLEDTEIKNPDAAQERIIYVCSYRCGEDGRTFTREYPLIQGGCPEVLER